MRLTVQTSVNPKQPLRRWTKARRRTVPTLPRRHGAQLCATSADVSATSNHPAAAGLEFRDGLAAGLTALALPPDRPVRLWVLDEMRHGLHGFTRRVWGLPGHRPVVPPQQKYQWGFVYGAVGVGLSRTEFLLTETMDQAHSVEFYRQISRSDPAALHVLIQDGAGFHLPDGDPRLPDNVRVVTLPAYSPEPDPDRGAVGPDQGQPLQQGVRHPGRAGGGLAHRTPSLLQGRPPRPLPRLRLAPGSSKRFFQTCCTNRLK